MMAYVCDRCGKVISRPAGDTPTRKVLFYGEADYDDPADGGELIGLDICDSCWDSLHQWLRRWQEEDE